MVLTNALREYRFKFYLNASHYVIFNNKKGQVHPHTWEFAVDILIDRSKYMEFNDFEKGINAFIDPYQDRVMNDMEPFDLIIPTLESMLDYFAPKIRDIIGNLGGQVIRVEGSETPTRSYIHDFSQQIADDKLIQNASGMTEYSFDEPAYDYGDYQQGIPMGGNAVQQSNIPAYTGIPVRSNIPSHNTNASAMWSNISVQSNIPAQSNVPVKNSMPAQAEMQYNGSSYAQEAMQYPQGGYMQQSRNNAQNMNDIFDSIISNGTTGS